MNPSPIDDHQTIVANLITALMVHRRQTGALWLPMPGIGTRVPVSPRSLPQPDVLVKERPNAGLPTTDDALVLFEVLSRSNSKADQAWRRKVYASVPNCQHYATVSLKAVEVVVYDRDTGWKQRTVASLHDSRPAGDRVHDAGRRNLSGDRLRATRKSTMNLDQLKTTEGLDVKGKRVLLRADLNVPMQDGRSTDATRLERLLPGVQDLATRGAKVVAHLPLRAAKGRPGPAVHPAAGGGQARGLAGRRSSSRPTAWAGGGEGRRRAAARRHRGAGEPSLPQGRGEERRRLRPGARQARRHLRRRRLLHRAPRACLHRCHHRVCCRPMPARC